MPDRPAPAAEAMAPKRPPAVADDAPAPPPAPIEAPNPPPVAMAPGARIARSPEVAAKPAEARPSAAGPMEAGGEPAPAAKGAEIGAVADGLAPVRAATSPAPRGGLAREGGAEGAPAARGPGAPGPAVAVARPGEVSRPARPSGGYQVIPRYPATARREGAEGTTLLKVLVLADGRVGDVAVHKSAGHPDLDRAAADAVRQWHFDPARKGSQAVAMWVLLPVEFRLRD
jgi:protein TonB